MLAAASRQDQYCSSRRSSWAGKRERKGPPPQSPPPSFAQEQWGLQSILQLGCSLWPQGPSRPVCTGPRSKLCLPPSLLTQPPPLHRATSATERDPSPASLPSIPSFLHFLFSVWTLFYTLHFYSLNSLLTIQMVSTFFCNSVFFFFFFRPLGNECVCASQQEQRLNCYHSPVIHLVLPGQCQGTSYCCCCTHN